MTPAKGYTEMKDSGIEWIGEIPSHWKVGKVKNIFSATKTIVGNDVDSYQRLALTLNGVAKRSKTDDTGLQPEKFETYQTLRPNELVFKLIDLQNVSTSRVGRSSYEGIVSPAYIVLHEKSDRSTKFAEYFFLAMWMHQIFNQLGADGVRSNIGTSALLNLPFIIVPDDEQSAIAAYLDPRCTKIDEIIAQAKASIEDYKQWKASIIYEAVTKGLDPNVEMKDSGIEWIGEIPSDWTIIRVKNLLTEINDRSETGSEEPLSMSQVLGIVPSSTIAVANPATSYVGAKIVQPNDLVFNKLKAHLGVFAVSNYDGLVSPDYAVYRANERANPKFLEYLFKTPNCIQEFKKYITGVGAGLSRLYTSDLFNIKVALPVIDVQKHIIEYLNDFCSQADALIGEKQSLIDDLESYKKSLIYEVVTGKRRVENISEITISILSPEVLRYRKALLMLRVLDLLGDDTRGRIQLQKCMFAAECLLNMPFHTQFIRYKHGPYDPELLNLEAILSRKGWYTILKGSPVTYQKGEQFGEGLQEYMNIFSDIDLKLEKIVGFLKPMKTSQAERVATLLAVWNDFIIDGILQPTDKEIINEVVTHWTPNKANPQYSTWQNTLYKMRENQFVPKGTGVHTQQKKSQQER